MLRFDPAGNGGARRGRQGRQRAGSAGQRRFILYTEGPADRGILRGWAYRLLPSRARLLFESSVILGGRRPARALEHFRAAGGAAAGSRALCVLDRDDGANGQAPEAEPGLEIFTWSRRHIESYLLVPEALGRALGRDNGCGRALRLLRSKLPHADDEAAYRQVDAKRLLGPGGLLPRALGRPIDLSRVARLTRENELHGDVHALFTRLRAALEDVGAR